eukprot:TRINITY_DN19420_c0_g3_i1.p1 TRINITY_DN19420_c0_g3~~TRINITY_DN19420_c0_g3_i1.p1  ORF type:complete len:287 (-),score=41.93 TRINITY_DN19420_c0_g3_i1:298-1158(-)
MEELFKSFNAHLYSNVVSNTCLGAVLEDANKLADLPNYWIPKDKILKKDEMCTSVEAVVCEIYNSVMNNHLHDKEWSGVEYWVQIYEKGRGLAFHFDKDEQALEKDGIMVHPILSSVFYLSGDATTSPYQGPTIILSQFYDPDEKCVYPEDPDTCGIIHPRQNSMLVFDGGMAHGVLDSDSEGDTRATLLINWWASQPDGINQAPDQFQKQKFDCIAAMGPDTVELRKVEIGKIQEPLLVDAVIGWREQGCLVKHVGSELYPLDVEDQQKNGSKVNVYAAFVPSTS